MIVHSRLDSTHLKGDLLGDLSLRGLYMCVPPNFEESDQRYPTAYLLHAFGGTTQRLGHPPIGVVMWRVAP